MGEPCRADELRTLFLFERLSDSQLATLCQQGQFETFDAGTLFSEGEPARYFYVLIEGELVMSGRTGGIDVQTHRTSQRGAYCGAWTAYVPSEEHIYDVSVRLIRPSRFYVLSAPDFADFMRTEFPMAVHLLAGHTLGGLRQQQLIGQRAKLLALGTITAGLTHHLNNPAAAAGRAVAGLRETMGAMRRTVAALAAGAIAARGVGALVAIQDEAAARVGELNLRQSTAMEAADREDSIGEWLEESGLTESWDTAAVFAEAGLDVSWLDRVFEAVDVDRSGSAGSSLQTAVDWLRSTIDAELQMREIADASTRMSALLASAKLYSQMDRDDYQRVDVHDLLRSTLAVLEGAFRDRERLEIVTDFDESLPAISCYAGELNQLWTNLIENAVEAMGGRGRLTLRTRQEREGLICVDVCDDGPGIPEDIIDRIFVPFFSTKPQGHGTGLGLDLARRIVEKHRGELFVESRAGDTRFTACLPLQAPPPEVTGRRGFTVAGAAPRTPGSEVQLSDQNPTSGS